METPKDSLCIGVLDSGVGGLTVVKELERLMPMESVCFFGDSANCPYGNSMRDEITRLAMPSFDFLSGKGVKIAVTACSTISSIVDSFRNIYDFPIVSIIEAACVYVAGLRLERVGVFATEFTVNQGLYEKLITGLSPGTRVYPLSSRTLARSIDAGYYDSPETVSEVRRLVRSMREIVPGIENIILGCTHYPIVEDLFVHEAPDITFINPAFEQAKSVKELLLERGLLANGQTTEREIYTSGDVNRYKAALKKLGISGHEEIHFGNVSTLV